MTCSIRRLASPTVNDIDALAATFDQYRVHHGQTTDVDQSALWLRVNLAEGRMRALVAEDGSQIIGFLTTVEMPASLRLSHFVQIRDMYVLPEHRRRGIAASLFSAVRELAVEAGALRVTLQTEDENAAALALYAKAGFVPAVGYQALVLELD